MIKNFYEIKLIEVPFFEFPPEASIACGKSRSAQRPHIFDAEKIVYFQCVRHRVVNFPKMRFTLAFWAAYGNLSGRRPNKREGVGSLGIGCSDDQGIGAGR